AGPPLREARGGEHVVVVERRAAARGAVVREVEGERLEAVLLQPLDPPLADEPVLAVAAIRVGEHDRAAGPLVGEPAPGEARAGVALDLHLAVGDLRRPGPRAAVAQEGRLTIPPTIRRSSLEGALDCTAHAPGKV